MKIKPVRDIIDDSVCIYDSVSHSVYSATDFAVYIYVHNSVDNSVREHIDVSVYNSIHGDLNEN